MDSNLLKDFKGVQVIPIDQSLFNIEQNLYKYKECVFDKYFLPQVISDFPDFELRKDDVLVASFPKSGTTWLQEIVYMLLNNLEESNDQTEKLENRFPFIEFSPAHVNSLASAVGRRFIKTHVPFHLLPRNFGESGAKLIYIERDPRDVVVSMYHFYRLRKETDFAGTFEQFVHLFINDQVIYTPFFPHLKSYRENESKNVLIVSYEETKQSPEEVIKRIAVFLEVPLKLEEAKRVAAATSFSSMSKNKSVNYSHWVDEGEAIKDRGTFMRKGEVGDWKNHFTAEVLDIFTNWEQENGSIFDTNKPI